ncbi:hypothetical protein CEUSTIGMA_g7741.t1 [Chlamydomonas eustigma]|uniref:RRM domain-containing protein n=1 Tax=Chlamydomonas eustigma TaxID=1157962 RepID=A0A250XB34_9CHLO|nr:hypothetical protein CEUSTIGMA_g7741.t1 [Chlamydomonas eustigma]|eukprot:GAX80303.1 hypothetical protein CEUSTIGMA_g7741.t1 [Chlamydomonas eustigma]
MDSDPPHSRLFVVCGRAIEAEILQDVFSPYGCLQNIKLVKDKGVAYVKYDKASSAAFAIETLNGTVLNDGRGPKLKVMIAEAPMARGVTQSERQPEPEISSDPDNMPPRSRLFIVVPKQADVQQIQDDLCRYKDLEYCKTDLIAQKGVVFCKFTKSSSALMALEEVNSHGMVAGYKVKCMLAEPKTKRRVEGSPQDMFGPQTPKLDYGLNGVHTISGDHGQGIHLKMPMGAGGLGISDYAATLSGLSLGGSLGNFQMSGVSEMQALSNQGLSNQVGLGFVGGLNNLQTTSPMSPNNLINSPSTSRQRLFVVVHKGVSEDLLQRLFRRLPGMEYCDLKKDRTTGRSKGFCYINYSTQEAATAAIEQFNGVEFPPQSGHRIKVMFAEPLGTSQQRSANGQRSGSSEADTGRSSPAISMLTMSSPSPVHTPLALGMGGDVVQGVQESLATMSSVQRQAAVAAAAAAAAAHNGALDQMELAARIAASPGQQNGTLNSIVLSTPVPARELMFNGMSSS